jgi:hypothetical protein
MFHVGTRESLHRLSVIASTLCPRIPMLAVPLVVRKARTTRDTKGTRGDGIGISIRRFPKGPFREIRELNQRS